MNCPIFGHDIPPGKEIALGPSVAVCYHCECVMIKEANIAQSGVHGKGIRHIRGVLFCS
jgi:hypothetical protein